MSSSRKGFTIAELLTLLGVAAPLLVVLLLHLRGPREASTSRQIKDATQIRGIHQGLVLFAQNNNDNYPLPGQLDKANTTLGKGSAKDDLGGVLSVLLWNGFFSPELAVSPLERSSLIKVHDTYALTNPPTAVKGLKGDQALWDPGFRGSGAEKVAKGGMKAVGALAEGENVTAHNSYALMPFFGARSSMWSNTFEATEAAIGNRGPSYEVVGMEAAATYRLLDTGAPTKSHGFTSETGKGTSSVTLGMYGDRSTWRGNIAYNDNHTEFHDRADPENNPFTFSGLKNANERKRSDNLFVAEDDATVTPLPTQIGTVTVADKEQRNPLRTKNNWIKTWTVAGVADDATTSAITVVVD